MKKEEESKLRICFLIATFSPVVGGGETHALLLAKELISRSHKVFVLTRRSDKSLKRYDKVADIPVKRISGPSSPRMGKYVMLLPAIVNLIKLRNEYDVIYVCAFRVLGIAGVIAAWLTGKKCVLRAEACGELSGDFIWNSPDHQNTRKPSFILKTLIGIRNRLYKKADRFLSISHTVYDEFKTCGLQGKQIESIPNGVDLNKFCPIDAEKRQALKHELGLPYHRKVFVYSGKLNEGKGLQMLLRVWKRIMAKRGDLHLVLVGGGSDHSLSCERELEEYATVNQMYDNLLFTGYVDNVQEYLQCSDIFVFPSDKEAFGLAPIEAMACGLPVIATRVGELPYIIDNKKNGLLIDPEDEDQLYRTVISVANDNDMTKKIAAEGMKTVRNNFNMKRIADMHIKMFKKVMTKHD